MMAHDFVFQQCVGMAFSWIERKNTNDMRFLDASAWWWCELCVFELQLEHCDNVNSASDWWENWCLDNRLMRFFSWNRPQLLPRTSSQWLKSLQWKMQRPRKKSNKEFFASPRDFWLFAALKTLKAAMLLPRAACRMGFSDFFDACKKVFVPMTTVSFALLNWPDFLSHRLHQRMSMTKLRAKSIRHRVSIRSSDLPSSLRESAAF